MTQRQLDPSTPSKALRTHSRQVSSEAGTEFGTPESSFPTDSPTIAESTRMVGLGVSTPTLSSNGDRGSPRFGQSGDVFGDGQRLDLNNTAGRDAALDEVDQFLHEAGEGSEGRGGSRSASMDLDYSKTRIELNKPGQRPTHSSSSSFALSSGSHTSDPLLEVLDNDDDDEGEDDDEDGMEMFEDGDEEDFDSQAPLVGRRGRKRRRWEGGERRQESKLLEVSRLPRSITAELVSCVCQMIF